MPPATPARLSAGAKKPTKKRKSAEDSGSSCHMCPKTYKNVPMLKLHYVRAHFYAALRDKYVADLELSLPSEGGGMLTCQYCPFRWDKYVKSFKISVRIHWSIPLANGSGSGSWSCYFRQRPLGWQLKIIFLTRFFCLFLFEATFTSFSDNLTKFIWYLVLTDPHQGVPKTYRYGSPTLVKMKGRGSCWDFL